MQVLEMKASSHRELLNNLYKDPIEKKIIEIIDEEMDEDEKIKLLVEFIRERNL